MSEAKLCNIDGRWVIVLPEIYPEDTLQLSVRRDGTEWILDSTEADQVVREVGGPRTSADDWSWLPALARDLSPEVLLNAASLNVPERIDPAPSVNLDLL